MKTAAAGQELAYRVTITREEHDDWPPLVTRRYAYHVTEVSVLAEWDDDAGGSGSSTSAPHGGSRTTAPSAPRSARSTATGETPAPPAAVQARTFRQAAAEGADAAHAAWLARHLTAIRAGLPSVAEEHAAGRPDRPRRCQTRATAAAADPRSPPRGEPRSPWPHGRLRGPALPGRAARGDKLHRKHISPGQRPFFVHSWYSVAIEGRTAHPAPPAKETTMTHAPRPRPVPGACQTRPANARLWAAAPPARPR
jgi:hypothetical protein